ncbi:MAG: translation initiation factor IF-2 associated domain-containing protein, partial [Nitrosomonadaceae bacterium]
MAQTKVEQLANELGLLPAALLKQLQAAGVSKQLAKDSLTEKDKAQLLNYLRKEHGSKGEKSKITLTRRQTSEIRKSDSTGKAHTIQVEVRKKRVFVKRDISESETSKSDSDKPTSLTAPPVPKLAPVPSIDATQQALRQEEAKKQAELIARQTAEVKEKKQRKKKSVAIDVKESEPDPIAPTGTPTIVVEAGTLQPSPTEGTLHKPVVKPEDKAAKAEKKKKQTKQVIWKDDISGKRGYKPR